MSRPREAAADVADARPAALRHDFRYPDAGRYRNIAEPRVVRFLCSPFELAKGGEAEETQAMQALLARLVDLGLPFRPVANGDRFFDLAELVNFVKFAHFAHGERTWLDRGVATMRRLMQPADHLAVPEHPPELPLRPRQRHAVTIVRRFPEASLRPGARLRLHMPKPLNADLASHRVVWLDTAGAAEAPVDEGDRYSLRLAAPGSGGVRIAVRHEFEDSRGLTADDAGGRPYDLPSRAREVYLRPREGLVTVTPAVLTLASRLALDAGRPWETMRRIWDFLFDEVSLGFIHYDRLAAEDPLAWGLANRRMDCRTASALAVALCRAVGIPSRMLNGYTLHPVLPTSHTWMEAWIPGEGWRPFDTYAIDLAGDRRDSPWRDHFFGRVDDRFVAEALPLQFCGLGSPRLPARWQLCLGLADEGATTWFHALDDGALVYSESLAVAALPSL